MSCNWPSYNSAFFSDHLTQARRKIFVLAHRKRSFLSTLAPFQLERDDFLEIMQRLKDLLQGHLLLRPALPRWPVQCSNNQVIVAHDFWLLLGEKGCKKMFHIVLMCNEQITAGAVAARLVQRQYLHRIH